MATVQHSSLTGSETHEPKGVSTALANEVYVADGVGSGEWKKIYTQGFEDFNDSGTTQALTNGVYVDLTNDGAGAATNDDYKLPDGRGDIWDVSANEFDWAGAGLQLGDTVDIRFDVTVTSSGSNDEFILALDMAHGHANEYQLEVFDHLLKVAGSHNLTAWYSVYMGDTTTLNNPAKVVMQSDSAGDSVVVNGWYVRTLPRNPVLV